MILPCGTLRLQTTFTEIPESQLIMSYCKDLKNEAKIRPHLREKCEPYRSAGCCLKLHGTEVRLPESGDKDSKVGGCCKEEEKSKVTSELYVAPGRGTSCDSPAPSTCGAFILSIFLRHYGQVPLDSSFTLKRVMASASLRPVANCSTSSRRSVRHLTPATNDIRVHRRAKLPESVIV
ncbi:hypothetical protein J6590_018276 [Homalodisca vitripennis]|nr:hypothetical protein J6590_018276 [Homalodisca vitripennis]